MTERIGDFNVTLEIDTVMIKDLNGELLKAETFRASEAVDKYKELCISFREKVEKRKAAGK
tara:strand:- start:109 stop:291 length:183 start_codon:yes stop_codon:yes gene_type:complete